MRFTQLNLTKKHAGGGIRTLEPLRDWTLNLAVEWKQRKEEFYEWLKSKIIIQDANRYYRDLEKTIGKEESITHPHELAELFEGKPKHYQVAIKNFLKFLVEKGYRRESEVIDFRKVIKVPKSGIREPSKAFTTTDKIIEALEKVKDEKKKTMIRLLAYSGIRLSEAVSMLKSFDKSKLEIKGKVARYSLHKVGKTKKVFFAFMPAKFAKQLKKMDVTETMFKGNKLANGIVLPNMLRKWNAEFLLKHGVSEKSIDFIQGRTPERVLVKHYLQMSDLATYEYEKIVDKFPF